MKTSSLFAFLLFSANMYAQFATLKFELFAGSNMSRLRTDYINYSSRGFVQNFKQYPQLGGQVGGVLSFANTLFSPLVGLQISQNNCYASMISNHGFIYSTHSVRQIYYLRWNLVRSDMLFMVQATMGSEKNIRLFSGVMLSSIFGNLSKQRYWLTTSSPYTPSTTEHISTQLKVKPINMFICLGMVLPIPESKWSIKTMWRYSPYHMNIDYGLRENGVQLSLAYDLSHVVFKAKK